jgi:hypothetical protein
MMIKEKEKKAIRMMPRENQGYSSKLPWRL